MLSSTVARYAHDVGHLQDFVTDPLLDQKCRRCGTFSCLAEQGPIVLPPYSASSRREQRVHRRILWRSGELIHLIPTWDEGVADRVGDVEGATKKDVYGPYLGPLLPSKRGHHMLQLRVMILGRDGSRLDERFSG